MTPQGTITRERRDPPPPPWFPDPLAWTLPPAHHGAASSPRSCLEAAASVESKAGRWRTPGSWELLSAAALADVHAVDYAGTRRNGKHLLHNAGRGDSTPRGEWGCRGRGDRRGAGPLSLCLGRHDASESGRVCVSEMRTPGREVQRAAPHPTPRASRESAHQGPQATDGSTPRVLSPTPARTA